MKEGLYRSAYGHVSVDEQGGYAVFRSGHIYAVNEFQAYSGVYELSGTEIRGTLWLREEDRQRRDPEIEVVFSGTVQDDRIVVTGAATDHGAVSFHARLMWVSE